MPPLVCPECSTSRDVSPSMACMVRKGVCSPRCRRCADRIRTEKQREAARARFEGRFWSKIDKRGECWIWTAGLSDKGYGRFQVSHGHSDSAHRVAWRLTYGEIPSGLFVCHHCDHPPCCNPAHLFLGTHADNMRDMAQKGRRRGGRQRAERCKHGHPLERPNLYFNQRGGRTCRACALRRGREYQRRLNEEAVAAA